MDDFRMAVDVQLRFSDTDALGHVNNAVYLSYLEVARIAYLRDVLNAVETKQFGVILARVEIDYKSPAFHHETLVVGIKVIELGGASMKMEYRVEEKKTGRLVAQAKTVLVGYDYAENRVKRWPDELREKVEAYDGIDDA
jgi:acyl-CoA thioester hydrolase